MNQVLESPFNPRFGKRPESFVGRADIVDGLIREYHDKNALERVTIISGVRGSGKTSLLSDISTILEQTEDWIVVNVATTERLLDNLIGVLKYKIHEKVHVDLPSIQKVKIGAPFFSVELGKAQKDSSTSFYPEMLAIMTELQKSKLKVIFVIDEVNSTEEMREFVSTYQLLIREEFDIVLLMAGLPHYVDGILNDKVLTFLRRSHQIFLPFIEPYILKLEYERVFNAAERFFSKDALELAYLSTGGYPYLFQLIGFHLWRTGERTITRSLVEDSIEQSKGMLYQNVYSIIHSELSQVEQEFLRMMSKEQQGIEIQEIRKNMKKSSSYVNSYREKLIKKGIIASVSYGVIRFTLPYFKDYIIELEKKGSII